MKMLGGIRIENLGLNRTMTDSTIDDITSDSTHEIALEIGVTVRQGNHSTTHITQFETNFFGQRELCLIIKLHYSSSFLCSSSCFEINSE